MFEVLLKMPDKDLDFSAQGGDEENTFDGTMTVSATNKNLYFKSINSKP